MTELTLRIPPEMERELTKKAHQRGESVEDYVLELMRNELFLRSTRATKEISGKIRHEKIKAFDNFARKIHETTKNVPPISDDALTRMREEQGNHQL